MDTTPICPNCGKPLDVGAPKGLCPACLMQGAFPTGTDPDGNSARFTPPTVEELRAKFPQLEIIGLIGHGGMGAVYKARQKELDRIVALKILPPDIGQDAAFAERFAREARALAKLNHPGIVTIHDFGRADGLYFFLMEFVDGVNLRQLLHGGRISAREALAIVPQICDALQFAHDQGIVHRDIKPENILLDRRGKVKVADFGLAKLIGNQNQSEEKPGGEPAAKTTAALTDAGKVMGTPQYMSPEQIQAPGEVDHRADIYALGVVFYQMLTGELPGKKIEPPSRKVQIDVRLDEVVLRALEKKPELRYQQASVLKTQVETIMAENENPDAGNQKPEIKPASLIAAKWVSIAVGLLIFGYLVFGAVFQATHRLYSATAIVALVAPSENETPPGKFITADLETITKSPQIIDVVISNLNLTATFATEYQVGNFSVQEIRQQLSERVFIYRIPHTDSYQLTVAENSPGQAVAIAQEIASQLAILTKKLALPDGRVVQVTEPATLNPDHIKANFLLNLVLGLVLGAGLGRIFYALLIIAIKLIGRARNKSSGSTDTSAVDRPTPDRFWRWFAVAVLALIGIPIFISISAIVAAIVIPAFVKARAHAQMVREAETKQLPAETNLIFGPVIERILEIHGNDCDFLDFRTGETLRHTYSDGDADDSTPPTAFMKWAGENRVDIGICASTNGFYVAGLLALGMGTFQFESNMIPSALIPRFSSLEEWRAYNAAHPDSPAVKPLIGSLAGVTNVWSDLTAEQLHGPTNDVPPFFLREKKFALWFARSNLLAPIAFSTRDGLEGLMQITGFTDNPRGVTIRYKLVQSTTNQPQQEPRVSDAQVEPPRLQFLAWQDEWKTNRPGAARHPDGSAVTNAEELKWLMNVIGSSVDVSIDHLSPEPRFLSLWFSHPAFDANSLYDATLLDDNGKTIPLGARGSSAGSGEDANEYDGHLGWKTTTFSPDFGTNVPEHVTVRLAYTLGPLERTQEVSMLPAHSISMTLEGDGQLNGVGQNVDGKAFLSLAFDAAKLKTRRFGVMAETRDGREILTGASWYGNGDDTGVRTEEYDFGTPLSNVEKFIIGTRPIRTVEWTNVALPGLGAAATQEAPGVSDAQLSESPSLQFVAWQDEWKTNQPGAARHPDGSPVTDPQELNWLKEVLPAGCVKANPEQQFLTIWVSHPAFETQDFAELLDGDGNPIQSGDLFYGSYAADGQSEGARYGDLPFQCWKCWCFCPNDITNRPARLSFKLRYVVGPLEQTNELAGPNFNDPIPALLLNGSLLNNVGQDTQGRAFVSITVGKKMASRLFGVEAIRKDGRHLYSSGFSNTGSMGFSVSNFSFDAPLADVAKFIIGTRPIRTVEWTNVALPNVLPPPVFQMRLAEDKPSADSEPMSSITRNRFNGNAYTNIVYVQKTVLLDQSALESAKAVTDDSGQPMIYVNFTKSGGEKFAEITRQNTKKRLAIIINGQLCEAPLILDEISGGAAQIVGGFSPAQAKAIAQQINMTIARHR